MKPNYDGIWSMKSFEVWIKIGHKPILLWISVTAVFIIFSPQQLRVTGNHGV